MAHNWDHNRARPMDKPGGHNGCSACFFAAERNHRGWQDYPDSAIMPAAIERLRRRYEGKNPMEQKLKKPKKPADLAIEFDGTPVTVKPSWPIGYARSNPPALTDKQVALADQAALTLFQAAPGSLVCIRDGAKLVYRLSDPAERRIV